MAAPIRIVSSLDEVAHALQDLNITTEGQFGEVRFQLHEKAPLLHAANIKAKTEAGRFGFILVNPELLKCKFNTKMALETSFNQVLDTSLSRIDEELQPVEEGIAVLRALVRSADYQIDHHGPPIVERNRGVQHCIYPHPPFPRDPSFEHDDHHHRIPYQNAYATQGERDAAAARDKRAQRAIWAAKLRIMEARHKILKEMKFEMMSKMRAEFKKLNEEASDLGVGYADLEFPALA